jgi:hypothetical protein
MRLTIFPLVLLTLITFRGHTQDQPADTVIVPLGESSKIIFTIQDRRDLDILRHYNFQALFQDIFSRLEGDSTSVVNEEKAEDWRVSPQDERVKEHNDVHDSEYTKYDGDEDHNEDDDFDDDSKWRQSRRGRIGQTWQSYNLDLGTNNYIADKQFPNGNEPYAVRPWGSWYLAGNSVQRTKLGQNFFVEWGLGVSWYSFKFQEDNTLVYEDEFGVQFAQDSRDVDYVKSKLSATFVNVSLVPVVDFGSHSRKPRIWDGHGGGFRFGVGPYVGYRISSKTKLVFEQDGDRKKEKDRDNFYLNNLRYGFRVQIGVRSTDLFINYDMNELFAEEKGPRLNAISFGLIF